MRPSGRVEERFAGALAEAVAWNHCLITWFCVPGNAPKIRLALSPVPSLKSVSVGSTFTTWSLLFAP